MGQARTGSQVQWEELSFECTRRIWRRQGSILWIRHGEQMAEGSGDQGARALLPATRG